VELVLLHLRQRAQGSVGDRAPSKPSALTSGGKVAVTRVDEHEPDDLFWMRLCIELHIRAAERMTHQDVRRDEAPGPEQSPKILGDARCRARRSGWLTAAVAWARIGEHPRPVGDFAGDSVPGSPVIAQAGLEDDGGVTPTAFDDLHGAAGDFSAGRLEVRAAGQQRGQGEQPTGTGKQTGERRGAEDRWGGHGNLHGSSDNTTLSPAPRRTLERKGYSAGR
jgi:hypothetical protein